MYSEIPPIRNATDLEARHAALRAQGIEPPKPLPVDGRLLAENQFLGQTERIERPSADQSTYQGWGAKHLERDQERWDAAVKMRQHGEQIRADREARKQEAIDARRAEAEKADAAKRAEARAAVEAKLRARFMSNPASTAQDWERVKDSMIARHLEDEALARSQAAHRAYSAHYTG
jgi:hypothetical protein